MEVERLNKEWRAQNRAEWEAERNNVSVQDIRDSIERKVERLREQVAQEKRRDWEALSPETRDAYRRYEELKARDEGRAFQMPDHCPDETTLSAEAQARAQAPHHETPPDRNGPRIPPSGWTRRAETEEVEETEPKVRSVKDEGWE